jgi:hypothetical protein
MKKNEESTPEVDTKPEQSSEESTLAILESMRNIDVERTGKLYEWTFKKMTLEGGIWILIADFLDQIESLDMTYTISLVLNPTNYNLTISRLIDKYNNPQKEIFNNDAEYIASVKKAHTDYSNESGLYGIFDFSATVLKFERKTKSRQVKFLINSNVAEYFLKNFDNLHRSAIVLEKKSSF